MAPGLKSYTHAFKIDRVGQQSVFCMIVLHFHWIEILTQRIITKLFLAKHLFNPLPQIKFDIY